MCACVFTVAVDPALSFDRKLGDVARSLTSLTQNPEKEGEKRGQKTVKKNKQKKKTTVWKGQAFQEQVSKFVNVTIWLRVLGVAFFPPPSNYGCTAALARSGHSIDSPRLANDANVKFKSRPSIARRAGLKQAFGARR